MIATARCLTAKSKFAKGVTDLISEKGGAFDGSFSTGLALGSARYSQI